MKKTILGLIAVLVLGVGAYYSLQKEEAKTTMNVEESDFSVSDTSIITRIFIARKSGENYYFKKQTNGEWIVNDSWQAEKKMVGLILGTIHEMKVKAPVTKAMRNGVIRTLAGQGIKVELYDTNGKIKSFYVGNNTADDKGTFIIMDGSEQPYVVHIPRFNGYLTTRFTVNKENWIDKIIFQSKREGIEEINVEYGNSPESSFTLKKSGEDYAVEGVALLDTTKTKQYALLFDNIHSEQNAVVNEKKLLDDSLAQVTPIATINVQDMNPAFTNKIILYDVQHKDRMLAYQPQRDIYTWVQFYVFNKLMVEKQYFIKPVADL